MSNYYSVKVIPFEDVSLKNICGDRSGEFCLCWAPKKRDVITLEYIAQNVSNDKSGIILDLGCGSGLLAYLIAKESSLNVVGVDTKLNEASRESYQLNNLEFLSKLEGNKMTNRSIALIICSYVDLGINLTPQILKLNPQSIAFIRHKEEITGTSESYLVLDEYYSAFSWLTPSCRQIREIFKYKKRYRYADYNSMIDIRIKKGIKKFELPINNLLVGEKYKWERELESILGDGYDK